MKYKTLTKQERKQIVEFWGREFGEQEIVQSLISKDPTNLYFIDEELGRVYARNDSFETGVGKLFELLGEVRPETISANKYAMNNCVRFMNSQNRERKLEEISVGWTPCLVQLKSESRRT
jgi:hypothetical protein